MLLKFFARRAPAAVGLLAAPLLFASPGLSSQEADLVVRIPVTGTVEMGLAPFIERSLLEASQAGAVAVVLDIDTPGGRVDAAERIADALGDAPVRVYSLVNRRAFSAGALIALATEEIYMRPGSVIGAATPVDGQGTKASEKIVSAMRSEMRALAEARGLDPAVAEAMVDESLAVPGVSEAGRLLTLTTTEAVDVGYAVEVEDMDGLLAALGYGGALVETATINWAERLVRFLSNPLIAPFLLSLGFLGLVVEIKSPTLGIAGLAGLTALGLFFGSHLLLGLAGIEDLLVFGGGVLFVAIEVLVIPGFGFFGVAGIAGIMAGMYMSMLGAMPQASDFAQAAAVLATTMLIIGVTTWALLRKLPKGQGFFGKGIFLGASTDADDGYLSQLARPDLVGAQGQAISDLRPAGVGVFGDERIDIVSEAEWIEAGTRVEIIADEGYRHVVRPLRTEQIEDESSE